LPQSHLSFGSCFEVDRQHENVLRYLANTLCQLGGFSLRRALSQS
jgi:hypothetical protein